MKHTPPAHSAHPPLAKVILYLTGVKNAIAKISGVDTFQTRSVSQTRLARKLGQLSDSEIQHVSQVLSVVLSLD